MLKVLTRGTFFLGWEKKWQRGQLEKRRGRYEVLRGRRFSFRRPVLFSLLPLLDYSSAAAAAWIL